MAVFLGLIQTALRVVVVHEALRRFTAHYGHLAACGGRRVSRLAIGRLNGLSIFVRVKRYTVFNIIAAHGICDFSERRSLVTVAGAAALAAANASCDALIRFYLADAVIKGL